MGYPQHSRFTKKKRRGPLLFPGGPNIIDLKNAASMFKNVLIVTAKN